MERATIVCHIMMIAKKEQHKTNLFFLQCCLMCTFIRKLIIPVISIKGSELTANLCDWLIVNSVSSVSYKDLENTQRRRKLPLQWPSVTMVSGSEGRAAVALEASESKPLLPGQKN